MVAMVNDTVGTMMGCELGTRPCEIGLIVGEPGAVWNEGWQLPGEQALMGSFPPDTGTNACYMEEARHVAALDEDRGRTCVSIEWGSFYDEEALGPVLTTFDYALDHESLTPGAQRWWPGGGFPCIRLSYCCSNLPLPTLLSLPLGSPRSDSKRTLRFQSLIPLGGWELGTTE